MARADLILDLIKNSFSGNKYQFKKVVEAMIAEERSKQHSVLADKLQSELDGMLKSMESDVNHRNISSSATAPIVNNFLQEIPVRRSFEDLVLPDSVIKITTDFIEEQYRADLLRTFSLEPRNKILLSGEPGTGKTTFAEALAEKLIEIKDNKEQLEKWGKNARILSETVYDKKILSAQVADAIEAAYKNHKK